MLYIRLPFLKDLRKRGRGGGREADREREKHQCIVPLTYAFTSWFFYVSWLGTEPATLVCEDNALAHWATQPGPEDSLFQGFPMLGFLHINIISLLTVVSSRRVRVNYHLLSYIQLLHRSIPPSQRKLIQRFTFFRGKSLYLCLFSPPRSHKVLGFGNNRRSQPRQS